MTVRAAPAADHLKVHRRSWFPPAGRRAPVAMPVWPSPPTAGWRHEIETVRRVGYRYRPTEAAARS